MATGCVGLEAGDGDGATATASFIVVHAFYAQNSLMWRAV